MKRKRKVHKLLYDYTVDTKPITACQLSLENRVPKLEVRLAWDHVDCKNCVRRKEARG